MTMTGQVGISAATVGRCFPACIVRAVGAAWLQVLGRCQITFRRMLHNVTQDGHDHSQLCVFRQDLSFINSYYVGIDIFIAIGTVTENIQLGVNSSRSLFTSKKNHNGYEVA